MSGLIRLPKIEGVSEPEKAPAIDSLPPYTGVLPPSGAYRVVLRRLYIADNKTRPGVQRLEWLATIDEEDERRSQYNGYVLRDGQNFDHKGVPYMNRMLDAMGLDRSAFYGNNIKLSKRHSRRILAVGDKKMKGLHFYVATRHRKSDLTGEIELSFAPLGYLSSREWKRAVKRG